MIIGISGKMQSGKNTVASIIQYLIYKDKTKNPSLSLDSFLNSIFIGDSYSGFVQKSFAKKLKEIVSILTGIPVGDLEKQEVKNSRLPECWHKFDDNNHYLEPDYVRELLQILGTDLLRSQLHPNVFVNALFVDYITKKYSIGIDKYGHQTIVDKYPNWIVTDVRFPNELQAIKDRGGITIRVERFCYDSAEDFLVCNPDPKLRKIGIQDYNINKTLSLEEITDIAKAHGYVPFSKQHESETALDNAEFDYIIDNKSTIEELIVKVEEILIKEQIL